MINNHLEPVENVKREREEIPWTEEELRLLIRYTQAGFHVDATAFALKRSKNEVILQGLELGILTVERTECQCSEQAYLDVINGRSQHEEDLGKDTCWNMFSAEPRTLDKIEYVERVLSDKIWYMWYLSARDRIEKGLKSVDPESWAKAEKAAEAIVQKHGKENLGPYTEFEWGMLNGKLSAIRWVMGFEWDFLDQ